MRTVKMAKFLIFHRKMGGFRTLRDKERDSFLLHQHPSPPFFSGSSLLPPPGILFPSPFPLRRALREEGKEERGPSRNRERVRCPLPLCTAVKARKLFPPFLLFSWEFSYFFYRRQWNRSMSFFSWAVLVGSSFMDVRPFLFSPSLRIGGIAICRMTDEEDCPKL